jgi:hypothetical protein
MTQNNQKPDYGADLLGQVHVAVIRLDAKVDAIKDQIKEIRDLYNDHEKRIRQLEAEPKISLERLKAVEDRDYVAAATVWKVVGLICTLAGIGLTVLSMTR